MESYDVFTQGISNFKYINFNSCVPMQFKLETELSRFEHFH
jgi:hypothetical protein